MSRPIADFESISLPLECHCGGDDFSYIMSEVFVDKWFKTVKTDYLINCRGCGNNFKYTKKAD